ncbi:MAG: Holliday junction branch migration protein RuvA [Candidatus Pacebacteria bacterium]|nr:Holliday junction branch migration protein RuvA [Candidatus Paceibacterota bacterium]
MPYIYTKLRNNASFFFYVIMDSMISHILGKIIYKDDKKVILDKSGIGFDVHMSPSDLRAVNVGQERDVYTYLFLGEKIIELYGFLTPERLELFKTLKSVQGVGPKTAMSLAVAGSLEKLKESLEQGELPEDVKGVGVKRLQKILLEITGKIKEIKKPTASKKIKKDDIFDALVALGFSKQEVADAVAMVSEDIIGAEKRLKEALKYLGR